MADAQSMRQRFEEYRPSKTTLFWSCTGSIAATMILGFTWGGWVTGGTAEEMASRAAEEGRAQVAAAACVEEFMQATDAGTQLASLKDISSSWSREDFIEEGGWAMIADQEYDDAAELCAEKLMAMEPPTTQEAVSTDSRAVVQ